MDLDLAQIQVLFLSVAGSVLMRIPLPKPTAHQIELLSALAEVYGAGSHIPHPPQHPALCSCLPQLCSESQPTLCVGTAIQ